MLKAIYETRGRAREYSELACNLYRGCGHGCIYCYAPAATHQPVDEFRNEPRARKILEDLWHDAKELYVAGDKRPVLLCFTCDPYQPLDVEVGLTREAIRILHGSEIPVTLLTKGGYRAFRDFDLLRPGDWFGVTLTCVEEETSRVWEPKAAPPAERIEVLRRAKGWGMQTWVSCEPVLAPDWTFELIGRAAPFTDLFRVGKANHMPLLEATIDWKQFGLQVEVLLKALGAKYVLKNDLRRAMAEVEV